MQKKELQEKSLRLKEQGNELFKEKEYEKAIQKYSEAIRTCPQISIIYSNRSRCYHLIQEYQKSYKDAESAIKYDDKNIKAYFLMGQSLVAMAEQSKNSKNIEIAIEKLKKSLTLCPSQGKSDFQDRFIHQIYRAKKKLWLIEAGDLQEKRKALRKYMTNMIETDDSLEECTKDQLEDHIKKVYNQSITASISKIPHALVCPISKVKNLQQLLQCLMINPVVNEHGYSYSRKQYLVHLTNSKQDPITGKPIKTPNLLYSNINLKKAIESFLEKNPWAYEEKVA